MGKRTADPAERRARVLRQVDAFGRELRTIQRPVEVRAEGDDTELGFVGHASVFNTRAKIGGHWGWWEEVAPGAFAKTIVENDIRGLINHDDNLLLCRNRNGTLRLAEDDTGLACDGDMADVTYARDLATLLERGDINQMSIQFEVIKEEWSWLEDDSELRRILEMKLWDVSIVTFPAFDTTDAALRTDVDPAAVDEMLRRNISDSALRTVFDKLGIDADARPRVLRALQSGQRVKEDLVPLVQKAAQALLDLVPSKPDEPGDEPTRSSEPGDEPTRVPLALHQRRLKALETLYGLSA